MFSIKGIIIQWPRENALCPEPVPGAVLRGADEWQMAASSGDFLYVPPCWVSVMISKISWNKMRIQELYVELTASFSSPHCFPTHGTSNSSYSGVRLSFAELYLYHYH